MAAKWSSESIVAEHKDLQANAMALDCLGQYIVLAGRRCLAVVDLNNPSTVVKKVQRQSKWEVGSAEWNPHLQNSNLCAISSNQRTDIFAWRTAELVLVHSLRSHTRAVSDLHWHRFDPNLLATCSVDTFVNIWDIRDPRKPSISLSAVVGATQVRWNRVNGFLLATAHEGDVRIWDPRKSSSPVQYIAAHLQKIHGLDWSPFQDSQLATSSQDHTVKFFDVNNPRCSENVLRTNCPVWRARYTPFGEGLVTVVVPQLRRGENSLLLWSLSDLNDPVHTFIGHTDVVLDFEWKKPMAGEDDYQLVTWSKDQSLRVWRVDSTLQRICGFEPENEQPTVYGESGSSSGLLTISPSNLKDVETGLEVNEETVLSTITSRLSDSLRGSSSVRSLSPAAASLSTPPLKPKALLEPTINESDTQKADSYSLDDEINEVKGLNVSTVDVKDGEDGESEVVTIRCSGTSKGTVVVNAVLPKGYPTRAPASFQLVKGTNLDSAAKAKILKGLKQIGQQYGKKGSPALAAAVRHVLSVIEQFGSTEKAETDPKPPVPPITAGSGPGTPFRLPSGGHPHSNFLPPNIFGGLPHSQDHYVPYPRSSGARFCAVGILVCFGRPSYLRRVNNKTSDPPTTPRSFSTVQNYSAAIGLPHSLSGGPASVVSSYGFYPPVAQSPTGDPDVSISAFYNQDRRHKFRSGSKPKSRISSTSSGTDVEKRNCGELRHQKVGAVTIYDASRLMPQHLELAEKYVFSDTDVPLMCSQNAAAAAQVGRKDLVHLWSVASLLAAPQLYSTNGNHLGKEVERPWAQHPFGKKLLQSMIEHYAKQFDIQTVAMLCCAFGNKTDSQEIFKRRVRNESSSQQRFLQRWGLKPGESPYHTIHPGESPYHTIHPGDSLLDKWNFGMLKQNRSNSWSDSLDEFRPSSLAPSITAFSRNVSFTFNGEYQQDQDVKDRDTRLLDPKLSILYDNYRRAYADILYRWGLIDTRVQVLKYLSTPAESQKSVELVSECGPCRQIVRGPQCTACRRFCFSCVICRIAVKGPASFCLSCGHGGHTLHMAAWFEEQDECPAGCGCNCLEETSNLINA